MKHYKTLTTEQILKTYEFSHRFLVYYASQVAKDAMVRANCTDERSLHAVDVAERFGNGEAFTEKELREVAAAADTVYAAAYAASNAVYAASNAVYAASNAASNAAAYAANAAADAVYAANAASNAANAAAYASYAASYAANAVYAAAHSEAQKYYKDMLLELIEKRLTKLEKLLILD
jgi:hypothetical protein